MPKDRRQLTLDEDVNAILAELDNASSYIEDLVRDAEREWRGALVTLRAAGWTNPELRAACDALNGWGLLEQPPTWAAQQLADAERLTGVCMKHDASPERWAAHVQRVGTDAREARALVVLAREFWRFNVRVERAMEHL